MTVPYLTRASEHGARRDVELKQSLQISRVGSTMYLDEGNGAFVVNEQQPNELQRDR